MKSDQNQILDHSVVLADENGSVDHFTQKYNGWGRDRNDDLLYQIDESNDEGEQSMI